MITGKTVSTELQGRHQRDDGGCCRCDFKAKQKIRRNRDRKHDDLHKQVERAESQAGADIVVHGVSSILTLKKHMKEGVVTQ